MIKLKNTNLRLKKLIAVLLVLITICTAFPLISMGADVNLGELDGADEISIDVTRQYGHEVHTTEVDGNTYPLFCIEYGVTSPSSSHIETNRSGISDEAVLEAARWIFAGYYMVHGNDIDWLDMAYCQKKVWSITGRETSWNFNDEGYNEWCARAEQNKAKLNTYPSFNAQNVGTIIAGRSMTISDSNGVLKDYPAFVQDNNGVRIVHNANSNDITITVDKKCTAKFFSLPLGAYHKNNTGNDSDLLLYFPNGNSSYQKLIYSAYYDPISFGFNGNIVPLGNIELTKQDNYSASVDGATFGLYSDASCSNLLTTATSRGGKVKFEDLEPKTYYVKEISAPDGFLLNPEINTVTVRSAETSTNTIKNTEPTGTINLIKELDLSKTNDRYGDVVIDEAEYTLYAGEKITSKTGSKVFYEKDQIVATTNVTNDGSGKRATIVWDNLPLGSYYVKETNTPIGTFIDDTKYVVNLSYKDQNTPIIINDTNSTDVIKSMKVKIFKEGTDGSAGLVIGVPNAEFTIKLYADVTKALNNGYTYDDVWNGSIENICPTYAKVMSDENGNAVTDYLPYGQYIAKETNTPVNFTSGNDFIFSISTDESENPVEHQVKNLVVNNTPFEAPVKIVKRDADSEKKVTLSSATFKIRATEDIINTANGSVIYNKGDYVEAKVGTSKYNEFMTNSDGYIVPASNNLYASANDEKGTVTTPFKLRAGSYELVEIKNPNGFLINGTPQPFIVTNVLDNDIDADGDTVVAVNFFNAQPKGEIVVNKTIEKRNVDTSLIDYDNIDYSQISFELKALNDIVDMSDGSIVYSKGDVVGTYFLNDDATLTIDNLWIGDYSLQEISTTEGLVLDNAQYIVSFKVEDNTTEVYTKSLDIINKTTEFDFSKTAITGDKELEGAELVVKDADGNEIDRWISTKDIHKIEGLSVGQTYSLTENLAPLGYAVANTIYFTVNNTAEIQTVHMIDKQVTVSKVDITNDKELEGAELVVKDADGNEIDRWTSTKDVHYVNGLIEGQTYTLTEIIAPYGFKIANSINFIVSYDKDTQKVVMKDEPIYSSVRVIKCDIQTKKAILSNEFEFSIFSDKECTNLIATSGANKDEGTALFDKLRYGTYYIKETKAPLGYSLSEQVVEIVINENGVFADGVDLENEGGIYSFEYYDELLPVIKTGDNFTALKTLLIILCVLVILSAVFVVLYKKTKKQKAHK